MISGFLDASMIPQNQSFSFLQTPGHLKQFKNNESFEKKLENFKAFWIGNFNMLENLAPKNPDDPFN